MRSDRPVAAAVAATAFALAASPAVAAPTMQFDQPCYMPDQQMEVTGAGWAPGQLPLRFTHGGAPALAPITENVTIDAAGALKTPFLAPDLPTGVVREEVAVTATDAAGGTASTAFTLTDTDVAVPQWDGKRARRLAKITIVATGFTMWSGKPLYAHYVLKRRHVATVQIGTLGGPCGDLRGSIRQFPRSARRNGRYLVAFNPDKRYSPKAPAVAYRVTKF